MMPVCVSSAPAGWISTLRAEVEPEPTAELVTVITPGVATSGAAGERMLMLGRVPQSSVSADALLTNAIRQRKVAATNFTKLEHPVHHFPVLIFTFNPRPSPEASPAFGNPLRPVNTFLLRLIWLIGG
jgi:hypothetical protein